MVESGRGLRSGKAELNVVVVVVVVVVMDFGV